MHAPPPPTGPEPSSTLPDVLQVLDAVASVQRAYIAGRGPGEVFDSLLQHVLTITESAYGYIGEVLVDEEGAPYLKAYAMTDISWNDESAAIYRQAMEGGGFEFRNLRTLFGAVLTTGEPVIANDAFNDPRAGGTMRGHIPLERFLGLPLLSEGDVVGSVGVANRPGGYDLELVERLEPFLATCGNLVRAFRERRALDAAEARARANEEELAAVVGSAAQPILTLRPDGRVRTVNPAAREFFHLDDEDVAGRKLLDCVVEGDREAVTRALAEAAGAPVPARVACTVDDVREVEVSFRPIHLPDGEGVVAVMHDVTTQRRAEAELRRAKDQAERTSRAKDEFLASMSHELRTPLNGVLGLSSVLATQQFGPLNDKQAQYVEMIETSGRHLLELINDVLDVARIEADRFEIEQVEVDLAAVARDVAKVVAETAAAKGLRLIVDIDDAALVVGDPRRLRQVAFNLLSNATKFTDTGGRVVLRLEVIDDHVILTVADTGIGIPAARLPLLFQPFERVDSSLSRAHDGTGLGLVLTRRLVELHGGSIEVASIEGEGTTFTVRVPSMAAAPRP